jgi:DNA-directed RNA polymerase specialized sigma24 family protein
VEALPTLVRQAQAGDLDAYAAIVQRFQDMAVGFAYSLLGDLHLAEAVHSDEVQRAEVIAFLREVGAPI